MVCQRAIAHNSIYGIKISWEGVIRGKKKSQTALWRRAVITGLETTDKLIRQWKWT